MKRLVNTLAIVGSLMLLNTQTNGHHAFSSEFDIDRPIRLRGTITRMEWVNPHTWLHITAAIEDGTTQEWRLEEGTPNTLLRAGLIQQILLPCTEVLVRGCKIKYRN